VQLAQHLADSAKLVVGAVIGAVITVYFVQDRANQFARETAASNRAYAERQETLASIIPVLEKCKHAVDSLPDHDTLVDMPLDMIRRRVIEATERGGKALDDLEANSSLFEIRLEGDFGKDLAARVGAVEIRLHSFVDRYEHFTFSRGIRTKEQFLRDNTAYDELVRVTQEAEEISEAISDLERQLLTYKKS